MTSPRRMSPTLRDLVAVDRNVRPPIRRPAGPQVDTLLAIAYGGDLVPEPVSIRRALTVLARGARPEVALPVLTEIAADSTAPRAERLSAVHELGRLGGPGAQASLLSRIGDRDPRLQQAALTALGQFADETAEAVLARLPQPGDLAARRQLAFTRTLVAHRAGRGSLPPPVPPVRRSAGGFTAVRLCRRSPEQNAAERSGRVGSTYGIELAGATYGLVCGETRWTLVTNAALGDPIEADLLARRPWIAGLLCSWLPSRGSASPQYVLLSRPEGDGVRLDVVRSDGTVMYAGGGTVGPDGFGFTLVEVARPGVAAPQLTGRVSAPGAALSAG